MPTITESAEGFHLQCPDCTFHVNALIPNVPMVHLCRDRKVSTWAAVSVQGQKTSPYVVQKPKKTKS